MTARDDLSAQQQYDALKARQLKLNMQRGQPSDADFDLSNGLLDVLRRGDYMAGTLDTRNYPGGVHGLPEARELFGHYLDVPAAQVIVWNNASLELQGFVLTAALLHGLRASPQPWVRLGGKPKMIVTVPGYDRHFLLLETLGYELLTVPMQDDGPDLDAVEKLVQDELVKGMLFVPTYSNPSGETISADKARRLAQLKAAAPDFTIFADDAYRVHHLFEHDRDVPVNFVKLCAEAGHPDRAIVFASTSKITFGGAGLGFLASSEANIAYLAKLLGVQSIGPNKIEQLQARAVSVAVSRRPGRTDERPRQVAGPQVSGRLRRAGSRTRRGGRVRHLENAQGRLLRQPGHHAARRRPGDRAGRGRRGEPDARRGHFSGRPGSAQHQHPPLAQPPAGRGSA